jgi:hypothetical protein
MSLKAAFSRVVAAQRAFNKVFPKTLEDTNEEEI